MTKRITVALILSLFGLSANSAIVTYNYNYGYHNQALVTGGSNGASINTVYGDGPNFSVWPQNKCVNGNPVGVQFFCNDLNLNGQTVTYVGGGNGNVVAGNNGQYLTNPRQASYVGSLTYDTSQVFSYTDQITSVTSNWFLVTGGSLAWNGAYGFEVTVPPSLTSGNVGGSFFTYSFYDTSIAFGAAGGARSATPGKSKCDLGIAGSSVVGALLCGFANPVSGFSYSNSGTTTPYTKPVNWAMAQDNGDGTINLMMWGNKFSATGSGNNLQESLTLSSIPIPAAAWLFSGALAGLGVLRRRKTAA